jgi:hypothetical protein
MDSAFRKAWMAAAIALAAAGPAWADDHGGCAHCRNCPPTKKVCRWVPETKTIEVEKWVCECETICLPGRSEHCGQSCTLDCHGHPHVEHHWHPTCAQARTIKKLKKVKEEKKVCTWKWVVEEVCDHCAGQCETCLHHHN